jgi:hypothetical protein
MKMKELSSLNNTNHEIYASNLILRFEDEEPEKQFALDFGLIKKISVVPVGMINRNL